MWEYEKKVEIGFVKNIVEYCVELGVIPNIGYGYEYGFYRDIFGCIMDNAYENYSNSLLLPRYITKDARMLREIRRIHNIDVISLFEKYNVNELDGLIIASVLHEVGHMHLLYEDIRRYGYGKRQKEWENDYITNEMKLLEYRLIREEKYSDMFMINFLDKHIEDILDVCKEYLTEKGVAI